MRMRTMQRYLSIYYITLQQAVNYRVELLLWSVIDAMPLLGMLVLWLSVFESGDSIVGYTRATIITYYVSGYVFQSLTGSHFEEHQIEQIRSGKIVTDILRPISMKKYLVIQEVGWRTITLITAVLPVVILAQIFAGNFWPSVEIIQILVLPVILFFAFLLQVVFSLLIVAMAFVFEEAKSLVHLRWMLGWLFSGSMIPFELMPNWLENLSNMLPFKFRIYVPVQVYLGSIEGVDLIKTLIHEVGWLVVLLLAMKQLWTRKIKKFSAVGN